MNDENTVKLPPFTVEALYAPQSLGETIDWGLTAYHLPAHWSRTAGRNIKVAVLDTGIDVDHADLANAIDDQRDFTSSRFGAADRNGHGTHAAGIIAARQNGQGVVGVAPQCRLLIAKVLGDNGAGSTAAVAAGIDWACDAGADIINMSLGSSTPDEALLAAIQRAVAKGKFIIAAAGNDGRSNSVNYPARWKQTIAVAAVDRHGRLARFSSQGPEVDIAAPGQDVLSTFAGGGYAKLSGTSMAAPFVAGVTALLLALHRSAPDARTPITGVTTLREHLQRTAHDAGPRGHDPGYGWGLINPDKLLQPAAAPPGAVPPGAMPPNTPHDLVLGGITLNGREGVLVFEPR